MYSRSNYERETIINYNQADAEADVYTYDPALMRRLDKLLADHSEIKKLREGEYLVPKKWVKVAPPRRQNLTPEQRKARYERLTGINRRSKIDSDASEAQKCRQDDGRST